MSRECWNLEFRRLCGMELGNLCMLFALIDILLSPSKII